MTLLRCFLIPFRGFRIRLFFTSPNFIQLTQIMLGLSIALRSSIFDVFYVRIGQHIHTETLKISDHETIFLFLFFLFTEDRHCNHHTNSNF